MERFVYICNKDEFIKLIEAFGENLKVNGNIFHDNNVYALQEQEPTENKAEAVQNLKSELAEKFNWTSTDIIYFSFHPGGTSENEICNILNNVNVKLKNETKKGRIFITYHGSQNLKANEILSKDKLDQSDLKSLNAAAKYLIQPDVNRILIKYKNEILIEKALIDNAFGDEIDCDKLKIIFDVDNCDEELINLLKAYKNDLEKALYNVNEKYKAFYKKLKKISEK